MVLPNTCTLLIYTSGANVSQSTNSHSSLQTEISTIRPLCCVKGGGKGKNMSFRRTVKGQGGTPGF